jgi:transcriptional regulator with XRE-family HTH domain
MNEDLSIPTIIRLYRKHLGITQKEFGLKYEVGHKAVENWERDNSISARTAPRNVIEDAFAWFLESYTQRKIEEGKIKLLEHLSVMKPEHIFEEIKNLEDYLKSNLTKPV